MGYSQDTLSKPPNVNVPTFKSILNKMLGLSCFLPSSETQNEDQKKLNSEHNKAWLLAESGGTSTDDPHTGHSSFRFSLRSQVELDSFNITPSSSSATVLMVNLDNGVCESNAMELIWRRLESIERSISPMPTNTSVRFTYSEIRSATLDFSQGRVLGRGALSCVFRGRLGVLRTAVAVKRLDKQDNESSKAFCRELMIASSLYNPNVTPLLGFCIDPHEGLFLVYKYVSGGSLERHLHQRKRGVALSWSARHKVAVGIAEAIVYLQKGTEKCIVHRDIKPSNILLSSKKAPKLCDFGLATWTSAPSVPFLCKTVKGTFGYDSMRTSDKPIEQEREVFLRLIPKPYKFSIYMCSYLAPEYFQHGKVSDKTDVYALGVVLLELITGRKPIEARMPQGEENLVLWAKPFLHKGKGAIEELSDPRLKCTSTNPNQIGRMIEAAAGCITSEESRRPNISEIVAILKGQDEPIYSRRKKSGFLGNGLVIDRSSQLQQTNSEMKSHLALAMLEVSEVEDDDHLYGR